MIDYASDVGQVRLLIPDTDEANPLLSDAQIGGYLAMEGGDVKLAAAQALDAIASSEALISKKLTTMDGASTDGPAVAAELRARAQALRDQVAEGLGDADAGFDIVDFDPQLAYRHRY
ncbi:hypothetical protein GCM10009530_63790 [Microbispora corallina]|uniref:Uncharacterized protein n=1 Tax=Microbispora corallina TaxID=83302 RepID=A0ABQ4GC31_9ACTN|nr:hypothetical protein [Microbispora corallina]GIH44602.1 hypothetical protein Mco01_76020 [Microbispora corallina]